MADLRLMGEEDAQTFMIAAGLVFEIIAAFCSSPQTAELNAHARSATLMKWVVLGLLASGLFVYIAAVPMKGGTAAFRGGALAGVILGMAYFYANQSGLKSNAPGTESY
jgi:hypothetical protein